MDIGHRIRELREAQELTVRVLSDRTGLAENSIARIERGERIPSATSVEAIARGLGVAPGELFEEPAAPLVQAPPESREAEEERRKRERLTTAPMHKLAERGEALEGDIKSSPDSFPLGEFGEFADHYRVYRMLYEELASKQAPSPELQEAFERLDATKARI